MRWSPNPAWPLRAAPTTAAGQYRWGAKTSLAMALRPQRHAGITMPWSPAGRHRLPIQGRYRQAIPMTFPPGHPLHEVFEPPADHQGIKHLLPTLQFARQIPTLTVLALLASIAVPLPLSPTTARFLGSAGLACVAGGLVYLLAMYGGAARPPDRRFLLELLARSQRIEELAAAGHPLSAEDHRRAVEETRSQVLESSGWVIRRTSVMRRVVEEQLVPDLPLPPATQAMINRVRAGMPGLVIAARMAAATWIVLGYFLTWTCLFLLVWAYDPADCEVGRPTCEGSLQGFGSNPDLGDFVFLTLNASAANMPPDLAPRSDAAHAVFAGAFVSAVGILAITATTLWGRLRNRVDEALGDTDKT
jgi:hypothetical protein